MLEKDSVAIQQLLNPGIINLTFPQHSLALENLSLLSKLGYQIEDYGDNSLLVRTIPSVFGTVFNKKYLINFIDEIGSHKISSLEQFCHEKIAKKSCKDAIKAGDTLELSEIKAYVKNILEKNFPATCPHGRPIIVKWSLYELDKMFKRIV